MLHGPASRPARSRGAGRRPRPSALPLRPGPLRRGPGPREDQVPAGQPAHGAGARAGALPRRGAGRAGRGARLRELYHAVVYCVGAATDRHLGVPGEDLPGSWSATEFVSWYSAHPDAADAGFLRGVRSAVVVGVGNVAVDVTRMLARGAGELHPTDMPHAALTALTASEVTEIQMVGRAAPRRPASPPRSCGNWAPCPGPPSTSTRPRRPWTRRSPTRPACLRPGAATSRCCAAGRRRHAQTPGV